MQFDKNLIAFKVVLPNGMLIQEFERIQNKSYMTIFPVLSTKDQNGNEVYQNLSFIPCDDTDLQDYYCVDFSNVNSNKVNQPYLTYYPYDNEKQKLQVLMLYCTSQLEYPGTVCATHEETQKEIINFKTQVYTRVTSQQYNPSTRSFEKKIKLEQFYLSDNLVFLGKFSLKSTTTTINDGFIIQKQSSYTYISDYSKTNEYSTFTFQQAQNNLDMIGACFFYLDENGRNQFVQFVQFPSILAQFVSVFNSLLVVGIISRQFSKSEIIQDIMEIQLKNYYKKSAIEFMHEVETKKQSNSMSNYFQNSLMQTYKQICNMDYKYYMKKFLDTTLYNKIKLLIFSKGGKTKRNDPKQVKMFKRLMDSTIEQINIYDIQKEILKLKMMVRMSFTVEQYAALQLCGLRIILDEDIPNVEESIQENIQMQENLFKNTEEESIKQKKEQSIEMELKLKENEVQAKYQDKYLTENAVNLEIENIQLEENNLSKPQEKQNTKVEFEDNIFKLDEKNDQKLKKLNFKSIALNHLEKIERLERDNTYFEQKIDQFFNQKNFQTQLDQRILDCLIGYKQNKLDTQSLIPSYTIINN
ncbi:phosphatidylserine decarboxylase family protein, putative (macronuclear) [Tetrahymena thermophila SB210]|uniref:Phosphatidylserine decarboxylase family protein, putative n=1 Tax=Tetrahymena thermophila (strain SB210) TaxID=312017 RepID=W7XKR0_TETTS|nr:phosphatidylserine decarboxylase family protein, putative [Tetrahymena thermophila SB210]EWS76741.1 phosphatidylserine decarboxylase family protein, putative [Tetrahymena thermophila SB210]|eukprot:XP_012650734.1 phosphatidylserine decarboxylase family protein, putative [Tetrahymena thermophila SB210]